MCVWVRDRAKRREKYHHWTKNCQFQECSLVFDLWTTRYHSVTLNTFIKILQYTCSRTLNWPTSDAVIWCYGFILLVMEENICVTTTGRLSVFELNRSEETSENMCRVSAPQVKVVTSLKSPDNRHHSPGSTSSTALDWQTDNDWQGLTIWEREKGTLIHFSVQLLL